MTRLKRRVLHLFVLFALMFPVTQAQAQSRAHIVGTDQSYDDLISHARSVMMADPRRSLNNSIVARRIAKAIGNPSQRDQAEAAALSIQGEALLRIGDLASARTSIEMARQLATRTPSNKKLMGDIMLASGSVYGLHAEVAMALKDFQSAFYLFLDSADLRGQSIALIYIANLYSDGQDHKSALRYLKQVPELGTQDQKMLLSVINNKGTSLAALDRNQEAAAQFIRAFNLAKLIRSPGLQSQILRNLVRAHLANGDLDAAAQALREAMIAARRAGGDEEPAMLSAAAQLSFQRGRLAEGLALIDRSFAGVDLGRSTMPMREAHLTAYQIYNAVGDPPKALAHLEALKRLDDEATKLATQTSTALMGARFDFANQELRITQLKAEKLQRSVRYEQEKAQGERVLFAGATAAGLVVVMLLAFSLLASRRSRNAVRAANDNLETTNTALSQALAAKTEFLATTSHEIRTPLNGILGMTEVMLLDPTLADQARDRVRLVHGAGKTMRALIDDILDVAKIEKGKLTLEQAPFDLTQLLHDAAGLWEGQIRAKGIGFSLALDLPTPRVSGDSARLRQIVFNLLSNAAKFTTTGSITLGAQRENGVCRIAVIDTGIGIIETKLGQVFESFRQADASTTRRFGGTGLGLSISRSLARAMGGELAVASSPGSGSTFTLTIPLSDHVEEEPGQRIDGNVVLIVDRNPIMRATLRNLVAPHVDRVVCAADVEETLNAIKAEAPRSMLLDENIFDGQRLSDVLAVADRCGAAVTILRTANAPDYAIAEVGNVQVIAKPISGPALISAMFAAKVDKEATDALVSRAA